MSDVDYLGEGQSDLHVARKLIELVGAKTGQNYFRPGRGSGKGRLDQRLRGLNAGAGVGRLVFVLRDMDDDAPCAGGLISRLLPDRHDNMVLRVAVRSAEAWYVADTSAYATYCGMPERFLPRNPEEETSLKRVLLRLAEEGVARKLRSHLIETRNRGVPDWAALGGWHADFVRMQWSPQRAAQSGKAPSLQRAIYRLHERVKAIGAR